MKYFPLISSVILALGMASVPTLPLQAGSTTHTTQETALDLAGKPVNPLKDSSGKVVVLIFVRTDCPVSNRYAPTIQRLSAEHTGDSAFWLVYPSKDESAEEIREHDREYGYKIPAVRDPQKILVRESHAQITPEAAVFNAKGELVYHGRIDNLYVDIGRARTIATTHELEGAIRAALSGKHFAPRDSHAVGCYIADLE
ncbi:MAG TPA: redoxin family protein [Candidatus Acidoferrum sp.]|nr:redoxin family protein [Candidatus Acidoferrum sp.]